MRCTHPPRSRAFAARTDPLAGPLAMERGLAPKALAKLGRIPGQLIAWRVSR